MRRRPRRPDVVGLLGGAENSRHRQEQRILGQVRRECRFDDRVEQRKKTQ